MSSFKENKPLRTPTNKPGKDKPLYTIGAVSQMYGIHPQTLRVYDREGLLKPARTSGNVRLYSKCDIERLEVILRLKKDLGVNRAGIEIILNLMDKLDKFQEDTLILLDFIRKQLGKDYRNIDNKFRNILEKARNNNIVTLKLEFDSFYEKK